MRSSFSRSPSSILSTGMPVQRETTWAMCSGVTASSTSPPAARPAASASASCFSSAGIDAIGKLAGLGEVAGALRLLELEARLVELLLQLRGGAELLLLRLPAGGERVGFLLEVGELLLEPRRRSFEASSVSFFSASRSIFSWMMRRSSSSSASGLESTCIRSRDAASSMRSIALSGRKRSVM